MSKLNHYLINIKSQISISDFENKSDRSLFISSEVTDALPFVHHFYISQGQLHYLVYDPVDDIVVDYYHGESIRASLLEYIEGANLNFFDLESFTLLSEYTLAQCSCYPNTAYDDTAYFAKVFEDVTLVINHSQIESAGYLMELHHLSNSIIGIEIRQILNIIHNCISNLINESIEKGENSLAILLFQHSDAVDTVLLALFNEIPVSIEDIKRFEAVVTTKEVLLSLLRTDAFRQRDGGRLLDKMLGKSKFTSNEQFIQFSDLL